MESECQCVQPAHKQHLTFSYFCLAATTLNNYFRRIWRPTGHMLCCLWWGDQGPVDHQWTCQGWSLNYRTRCSSCPEASLPLFIGSRGEGISAPRSKGLSSARSARGVRALLLIQSRPILVFFVSNEWFGEQVADLTNHDTTQTQRRTAATEAPTRSCGGNEISMAFLSHFWRSPAPFLFLLRTQTMCRTEYILLLRAGVLFIVNATKNTDFSHSFLCKPNSWLQANAL